MDDLTALVDQARADFAAASEGAALEDAKARYLGKSGSVTERMKALGKLEPEARREQGAAINLAKQSIETALADRRRALA